MHRYFFNTHIYIFDYYKVRGKWGSKACFNKKQVFLFILFDKIKTFSDSIKVCIKYVAKYCSVVCFMVWLLYGWLINLELLLSPEEQLICFIVGKCFTLSYTMQGFLEKQNKKNNVQKHTKWPYLGCFYSVCQQQTSCLPVSLTEGRQSVTYTRWQSRVRFNCIHTK